MDVDGHLWDDDEDRTREAVGGVHELRGLSRTGNAEQA
jgi:hypothetical protein